MSAHPNFLAAPQQTGLENPTDEVLPPTASITAMDVTSSRSPPLGRHPDEWAQALESAGGERLRAYIRRMVGSTEVIKDILQDAHERFLLHSGRDKRAPGAWLRTVIVRLAVSHLRNKRRHAEVALPQEAPELATPAIVVESEVERLEWDERFSAALRTLSADQLSLIELHYWHGMKVGEIAARWGKSVEAVQQRLTRALRRLRAAMLPDGTHPGES